MTASLFDMDVFALARNIRAGRISPVVLMEALLERIAAIDPEIDSFIHLSETA